MMTATAAVAAAATTTTTTTTSFSFCLTSLHICSYSGLGRSQNVNFMLDHRPLHAGCHSFSVTVKTDDWNYNNRMLFKDIYWLISTVMLHFVDLFY